MKVEITKERILLAASKCSTAKETLKTLFPEVFVEDKYFKLREEGETVDIFHKDEVHIAIGHGQPFSDETVDKTFLLGGRCNWEIKSNGSGTLYLIPTKK